MEQNRKAKECDKLVESDCRLQNQVISLQANNKKIQNKANEAKG